MFTATTSTTSVDCIIVGGGPGGVMLSLLLARQGVRVALLEAHADFERDFRGDTVHPSTLELLDQLGLLQKLRALPHATIYDFPTHFPDGSVSQPRRKRLRGHPMTLSVRQARFLDLLVDEASRYPTFQVIMSARVEQLIEEEGETRGVRYRSQSGWHEIRAQLVVGADGRFSRVRQLAGIPLVGESEPLDVLWLKLPYGPNDPQPAHGIYLGTDGILVVMDSGVEYQVGYLFHKGAYQRVRAAGIEALRKVIAAGAPFLADRVQLIEDWRQTSLLSIEAGRVRRWYQPGLLLIGDAAHVMSPVAGVGINYAIQDAVVAANKLGPRLLAGRLRTSDLACVQHRRELPTRIMQAMQSRMRPRLSADGKPMGSRPPLLMRLLMDSPPMAQLRERLIAFGGWSPERIHAPARLVAREERSRLAA
jgi:2-polyprenyl-6-methoxyphenol hydroxylase-like FAD-dependent oxidoreductase